MKWRLPDAKEQFCELIRTACSKGLQVLMLREKATVVIASPANTAHLNGDGPTLVDALLDGPVWDDEFTEIVLARQKTSRPDIRF